MLLKIKNFSSKNLEMKDIEILLSNQMIQSHAFHLQLMDQSM